MNGKKLSGKMRESLLGLPLEQARRMLEENGFDIPPVTVMAAPAYFAQKYKEDRPVMRVVKAKKGGLTVAGFRLPSWEESVSTETAQQTAEGADAAVSP